MTPICLRVSRHNTRWTHSDGQDVAVSAAYTQVYVAVTSAFAWGERMVASFAEIPNRDASAAIRGYGYQVDHTIIRWLDLGDGEILELECGEDIDLVTPLLDQHNRPPVRTLEQVKNLQAHVTLRSPRAISALVNAALYRRKPRGGHLRFRYTTSAVVGVEQRSPLGRVSAIEAWERVRRGLADCREQDAYVRGIKIILKDTRRPPDLGDDAWQAFDRFRMSKRDQDLRFLISVFEWSTGQPDARRMPDEVHAKLVADGYARSKEAAAKIYQRLFLCVFKTLCQTGRKQLTVEMRTERIAAPPLDGDDLELVYDLFARMRGDPARLTGMIGELGRHLNRPDSRFKHSFSYNDGDARLTIKAASPDATIRGRIRLLHEGECGRTMGDYLRLARETQDDVAVPDVEGLTLFLDDVLTAELGPGAMTITQRPIGRKIRGALHIRGTDVRLDALEFEYFRLDAGRVRLTNKRQGNAPLIVSIDCALPTREEFDVHLEEEGDGGMIDAEGPSLSLSWPSMAGRTIRRVLAAYKIVRALESPGVLDIVDYETDAPAATGHLDGVADLSPANSALLDALQLIQDAFPDTSFTVPDSPTEDDYRQIFKLAAIIRDGMLHVPWTSADMVFFAEVLRDCPDDGILTSKAPATLKAEDWPDELWGTRLQLGSVDGTFGSLGVTGPIIVDPGIWTVRGG